MSLPLHNSPDNIQRILTVIRFSNGYSDLSFFVQPSELTINSLRRKVRASESSLARKRLRFIHSGRVLTGKTNLKAEYDRFLKFNRDSEEQEQEQEQDNRFYIHCLIGDDLTPEELQKENEMDERVPEQSTTPAPIGFDRLASAGFSPEDINNLRQQFRQLYGDLPMRDSEGGDIRQLEERWIDSSVNEADEFNSLNVTNSSFGGNEELLIGVLIGCLLGVLSLFLLKEEKLFSKQQRMAIFAGFIVNFSFALVRQWAT